MIYRAGFFVGFIVLLLTPRASAQDTILASAAFSAGSGTLNNSGSGEAGWSGPWITQNGAEHIPGYNYTSSSLLQYSGLRTSGNYAIGGDNYQMAGRTFDTSASGPFSGYLSGGAIGSKGTTLWMSILFRKDAGIDDENSVTLHPGTIGWYAATPLLSIGYFGGYSNQGSTRFWSIKSGGYVVRTTSPVITGQTVLLVLRIDFGSSTATLYVNPATLGGAAPASAGAQTGIPASGFRSLAYYGGDGANESSMDEIRVGTSYAAVTPHVQSAALAYEPFSEPPGALNAVGTGSGWSGPWLTQNGLATVPGYTIASAFSLDYANFQTSGNYAVGGDAYLSTGRGLDVGPHGAFSDYLSDGLIGAPGKTLWFSVLLRKDAATGDANYINLHAGTPAWFVSRQLVGVGYFGSASNSDGVRYWSLELGGLVYQTRVPVVSGQAALLVLRIDFGVVNTATLYVNPTLGGNPPSTPSASATIPTAISFQSLAYYGGDAVNRSSIDEINFGPTFAAVTPINGPGAAVFSPVVNAPTGLAAVGGNALVRLSWAPDGNSTYNVKRSATTGAGYITIATNLNSQFYTDTTAANGIRYYYVVTALNSNRESPNSAEVTAMPQSSSPGPTPLGINVEFPYDFAVGQPFADLLKSGRTPGLPGQALSGNAPLDPLGMPLSDFEVFLADNMPNLGGTYKLLFSGQATILVQLTPGVILNQIYNSVSNITTADVILPSVPLQSLSLRFKNTQRTPGASTNSGLTGLKLMRPGYAATDTFTIPFKTIVARFQAIRVMEWTSTNSQQASAWADRTPPDYAWQAARQFGTTSVGFHSGGIAWEYCIQLANETGTDLWINIPHKATDDYILQLATLLKAQLRPGLKIYVEFSNETWNSAYGFSQINDLHATAVALVNAGGSMLNYDNVNDSSGWTYQKRLVAKRIVDTSNIFRSVFGDAAMMTRIRPVLESQAACLPCWFQESISFIDNYYGAPNPGNATPHSVNHFLYGGGGASYYPYLLDGGMSDTLTVDSIFNTWLPKNKATYYVPNVSAYSHWTSAYGLKNLGYEGGWSLDPTGHSDAAKQGAGNTDPRGLGVLIDGINTWNALGGDLYMYFRSSGDPVWNLTTDITNLNALRLQAIDTVNRNPRTGVTLGAAIPAVIPAVQFDATNTYGSPGPGDLTVNSGAWFSYTIRTGVAGTFQLGFKTAALNATGRLTVFLDGNPLTTTVVPSTGSLSAMQDTAKVIVPMSAGLHSIRVKGTAGSSVVRSVEITQ